MAQVPANDGFRRTLPILREYLPSLVCGIASRPVASLGYQHLTHAVPLAKLLFLVRAHSSAGEHCIQTTVYMTSALSSVVEHRLHTAGVAGSKPAVRTKKHRSQVRTAGTDLDLDLYRLRIRLTSDDTKTGKGRVLFFTAGTADLLRKVYRKRNPKARLFPGPDRVQGVPGHPDQRSRHHRRSHAQPLPLPGQEVADAPRLLSSLRIDSSVTSRAARLDTGLVAHDYPGGIHTR